jgi:hypothetical protein
MLFTRFTGFAQSAEMPTPAVWVNPANVAYVEPRTYGGTRIYFQQEAGVLDVREPIDQVVAELQA